MLRFVATPLGMAAAWKTKKKSIIFVFFSICLPCCHGARVSGKARLGEGVAVEQGAVGQEWSKLLTFGNQGCLGLAMGCQRSKP